MRLAFLLIIIILVANVLESQNADAPNAYLARTFISQQGDTMLYRILYPENYCHKEKYPLVLFLHGAGERGNDNLKQLTHGASLFMKDEIRKQYPAIVVFPQCPTNGYWIDINVREHLSSGDNIVFNGVYEEPLLEQQLLDDLHLYLIKSKSVDHNRLYIMGLSMGALGTFEMLAREPNRFAAAITICGGGNVDTAVRFAPHTAVWITHGTMDGVVSVDFSRRMYDALKLAGANVRYTEFPDANHNAWDPTFDMPDLIPWLFSK